MSSAKRSKPRLKPSRQATDSRPVLSYATMQKCGRMNIQSMVTAYANARKSGLAHIHRMVAAYAKVRKSGLAHIQSIVAAYAKVRRKKANHKATTSRTGVVAF